MTGRKVDPMAGHWPRCAGTGSRFTGDAGVATCPVCGRNNVAIRRGKMVAHKGNTVDNGVAMRSRFVVPERLRGPTPAALQARAEAAEEAHDTGRRIPRSSTRKPDRLSFVQAQGLRDLRDHGIDDMLRPTTLASLRRRRLVRRDRALIGHLLTDRGQLALRAHDERQNPKRPPCGHERIPVLRARTMATTLVAAYLRDLGGARCGHAIERAETKLIANIANTIARVTR